jgi:uncharacterized protein YhaN
LQPSPESRRVEQLERELRTRIAELELAERHIAKLEEKLLELKEAKRQLKLLKQEKQALRKSPERKIGQVLLVPYRLPQKLLREVQEATAEECGDEPRQSVAVGGGVPGVVRASSSYAAAARCDAREARAFTYTPLISVITPVFNTPVAWLEAGDRFGARAGLRALGVDPDRRRFH